MEQLLLDAKRLMSRLQHHDNAADSLIEQTTNLYQRLDAMKQYRDDITELNEVAKHRPRSTLALGTEQENARIRQLQQENIELQTSLAEYQSALELIMNKYREQVLGLMMANKLDASCIKLSHDDALQAKIDKICEMAEVMRQAVVIDEEAAPKEIEQVAALEYENQGLRELLQITKSSGSYQANEKDTDRTVVEVEGIKENSLTDKDTNVSQASVSSSPPQSSS